MFAGEESTPWPEPGKGDMIALIAGLMAGDSLQDIAEATGVSVSTVQRRRKNPVVREVVAEAQREQRRRVHAQLCVIQTKALEALDRLISDEAPMVCLRAVTVALTQALRYDLAADDEPETQYGSGVDPTADNMLARQLHDDAWNIDLRSPRFEEGEETDGAQE